jgi:hypothetical protein
MRVGSPRDWHAIANRNYGFISSSISQGATQNIASSVLYIDGDTWIHQKFAGFYRRLSLLPLHIGRRDSEIQISCSNLWAQVYQVAQKEIQDAHATRFFVIL